MNSSKTPEITHRTQCRNRLAAVIVTVVSLSAVLGCNFAYAQAGPSIAAFGSSTDTREQINMEIVLSEEVVCAGEEVTVQMVTRLLNESPGIQLRNIEIYNDDLESGVDIRSEYFVAESDLNGNGFLDWVDLDGEDNVAPNGDSRSDEEFVHAYTRVFTETTTIVAGERADVFMVHG